MSLELTTVSSHEMTPAQLDAVIALCSEVFQLDYARYMDLCPERVHVLGYVEGSLAAHALWLERPLRIGEGPRLNAAYVEGVATRAERRGQGHGSRVMRRLQREIAGYDLGALSPAVPEWYARLGWLLWRGPLFVVKDGEAQATPDERVMVYRTPRTGALDLDAALSAPWRPFEPW
jgi:aminoglycoside 2'-N-acetyltransferase I